MRTSGDVMELGLYTCDCCDQELIFDAGDTFTRCPRCMSLCDWELVASITRTDDLEDEMTAKTPRYSTADLAVA